MGNYVPPVTETLFVLQHVAGIGRLEKFSQFPELNNDLLVSILEEAARLAREKYAPTSQTGDTVGARLTSEGVKTPPGFREAYMSFAESGWIGLSQPDDFGGQSLPFACHIAVSEYFNSANLSLALCSMLSSSAIHTIQAVASKSLKSAYVEKLISGEWTGTMNITEPQAGSDLSAIKCQAEPDGENFRISGQKIFISWGDHDLADNIVHLVLARLPGAPPGNKGISLFLVPKRIPDGSGNLKDNAVAAISLEKKFGLHGSPTCVMSYGSTDEGALGFLIGEPNRGLEYMFTMMNRARLEVGIEGVAQSERAVQMAHEYAHERKQGTAPGSHDKVPIATHADVQRMLEMMRTLTAASRALALTAAVTVDLADLAQTPAERKAQSTRLGLYIPIVKAWCTEISQEVTSLCMQIHGGAGYVEETGAAQLYRDARVTTIYEGTTGIQALDLVRRKLLLDDGRGIAELLREMQSTIDESRQAADLQEAGMCLAVAADTLRELSEELIAAAAKPMDVSGSAFDYLMLCGYVIGFWLLLRGALAALKVSSVNAAIRDAALGNLVSYMHRILPRADCHAQAATRPLAVRLAETRRHATA